jgi:uncharacterized peroxidase-related enzyme
MAHGEFLRQHSEDPELASHVMHDYRNADWDPQTRAMLDYAYKLTKEPESIHHDDFEGLKEIGLTEDQILATVLITCVFSFMTRLADGLGVEPAEGSSRVGRELAYGPCSQSRMASPAKKLGR